MLPRQASICQPISWHDLPSRSSTRGVDKKILLWYDTAEMMKKPPLLNSNSPSAGAFRDARNAIFCPDTAVFSHLPTPRALLALRAASSQHPIRAFCRNSQFESISLSFSALPLIPYLTKGPKRPDFSTLPLFLRRNAPRPLTQVASGTFIPETTRQRTAESLRNPLTPAAFSCCHSPRAIVSSSSIGITVIRAHDIEGERTT